MGVVNFPGNRATGGERPADIARSDGEAGGGEDPAIGTIPTARETPPAFSDTAEGVADASPLADQEPPRRKGRRRRIVCVGVTVTHHQIRSRHRHLSPVTVLARALGTTESGRQTFPASGLDPLAILTGWLSGSQSAQAQPAVPPVRPLPQNPVAQQPIARDPVPRHLGAGRPDMRGNPRASSNAAFWRIWLEHHEQLWRLALRFMAGNVAEAEDALSTAMVKGHDAYAEDCIRNERAWLCRLVHNACMDLHRYRRRRGTESTDTDWQESGAEPLQQAVPATPEEHLVSRERLTQLLNDLVDLPDTLLEPLLMRCLEEWSYEDIASTLDLTSAAVRKRVELARKRLRRDDGT